MAAQTGRTVSEYTTLKIGSAASDMQDMRIDELGDLGLDYPETDMSAWSDLVHTYLVGIPDFVLEFGGPVDNTATTGPSTLLRTWVAGQTLLSFDVQVGVRHAWEANEQQFGLSAVITTNKGAIITSYKESGGKYKAKLRLFAASGAPVVPAWGTTAEVKPAG